MHYPAVPGGATCVGADTGVVVPADLRLIINGGVCTRGKPDLRGCRRELPAVLLVFRHRRYGGQTMGQWKILEGVPAPAPHRCGPRRRVPGVRRLVCSGVGRLVSDKRNALRGRAGIPRICGRGCRSCSKTRAWPPAAGLACDDHRSGGVGVRLNHGAVPPNRARQCRTSVPAGGDGRVLGFSVGRLRRAARISIRLSGRLAFPDRCWTARSSARRCSSWPG